MIIPCCLSNILNSPAGYYLRPLIIGVDILMVPYFLGHGMFYLHDLDVTFVILWFEVQTHSKRIFDIYVKEQLWDILSKMYVVRDSLSKDPQA